MAKVESQRVVLKNVRLSFPSLFHKAEFNGVVGKYEATFLIDKNDKQLKVVQDEISRMADGYFQGKAPKGLKTALDDGDLKDYDGYAGMMSLKAGSSKRVTILDKDKSPIAEEDEKIYAGCYVNAVVDFWVQDNSFGKRVNCNLLGVQFSKDGESFGSGSIDVSDAFDEVEDDDIF